MTDYFTYSRAELENELAAQRALAGKYTLWVIRDKHSNSRRARMRAHLAKKDLVRVNGAIRWLNVLLEMRNLSAVNITFNNYAYKYAS